MKIYQNALQDLRITTANVASFKDMWRKIILTDEGKKEIDEVLEGLMDTMPLAANYWLTEEDMTIDWERKKVADPHGYSYSYPVKITFEGGELKEPRTITFEEMPDLILNFCTWWLVHAATTPLNHYVTRAARKFIGGDFDAWGCDADDCFEDLLLQHILFEKIIFG